MGIWRCNQNIVDALEASTAAIVAELVIIQELLAPTKEGPPRAAPPEMATLRAEETPIVAASETKPGWFQRLIGRG
jgi:hypothetical protein